MLPLTIAEIVGATQGILVIGDPKAAIEINSSGARRRVSVDTRTMRDGDIYFALKGDRYDGHQFIEESLRKGASLCVVSQIPHDLIIPSMSIASIIKVKDTRKALGDCAKRFRQKYGENIDRMGISGSSGKTTVKEMIARIAGLVGPTVYTQGNLNNDVGCPLSIFTMAPEHRFGIFEIGASALNEVKRLAELIAPRIAVVTNIMLEHTATFINLDNIAEGESEILSLLPDDGFAVLPRDDSFYDFLRSKVELRRGVTIKSFGFSPQASVRAENVSLWPGPARFTLIHQDDSGKILDRFDCALPALGRFNVLNACAAAAASFCLGIGADKIIEGLESFTTPNMRFQTTVLDRDITLINDSYNANPGSMRSAIEGFVESFPNKRLCVVLGDMLELGEISRTEHQLLGKFLAGLPLSKILLYGPQARFIQEGARSVFADEQSVRHYADKETLIGEARLLLKPGTAILFKASRGMRLEEVIQSLTETVKV